MDHPLYVIGIDGGGTKTTAVLCALDGTILVEEQGGPSNVQIHGIDRVTTTVLNLIQQCCRTIGCTISQIGAVTVGLAGAGRLQDQQRVHDGIVELAQKRNLVLNKLKVDSDARIALEGAFSGKPGIIVIAGTGSIVYGKDIKGKIYRAGGWGRLIGDEGSGYSIGREAIRSVAQVIDGHGEKTRLVKLFEEKFELGSQESIIDALYQKDFDIASVVSLVIDAAAEGDRVARRIIRQASNELARVIKTVVRKMKKGKKSAGKQPLAFIGSLLTNDTMYVQMLRAVLMRSVPQVVMCPPESSPVVGATLMAIELTKE